MRQMASGAAGEIGLRIYTGRAHSTNRFRDLGDRVGDMIVVWLVEQAMTFYEEAEAHRHAPVRFYERE